MDKQKDLEGWEGGHNEHPTEPPQVGKPWKTLHTFHGADYEGPETERETKETTEQMMEEWGFNRKPEELKWNDEDAIYTDGSKGTDTVAGGGVTSLWGEIQLTFGGQIQTAHRGELLALREAVRFGNRYLKTLTYIYRLTGIPAHPQTVQGQPRNTAPQPSARGCGGNSTHKHCNDRVNYIS